jgi:pilus assembly protein CpaF
MGWLTSNRESTSKGDGTGVPGSPGSTVAGRQARLFEVKNRVHSRLVERLDLEHIATVDKDLLEEEVNKAALALLDEEGLPLNEVERQRLAKELEFEIMGLGPLEPLLRDPTINDILVNRFDLVYVERRGLLEETEVRFQDNEHLMKIINRIVSNVGRRIDESSPMVDARLPDGSRVNAVIPPLALDGPALSIRRFSVFRPTLDELLHYGSLTPEIGEVLQKIVKAKLNILVSGGTGSGKTTLLNILSGFIPSNERIITIEDSAELQLQQRHVVRMETRPPNLEGRGEVTQRDLVRNCLRMRPDRIILGEVRGAEVMDMMQAMNTGHEGSMTTVHANNTRESLLRLETMISLSGLNIQEKSRRHLISSSLDVIIQLERHTDGKRRMVALAEITGMEGDVISLQDVFIFERQGVGEGGQVLGRFIATGVRPTFADRCQIFGVPIEDGVFNPPAAQSRWSSR